MPRPVKAPLRQGNGKVFLAGFLLGSFTVGLALWVMFAGLCLYFVEQQIFEHQLDRDLDTLDSLIESELQSQTVMYFEDGQAHAKSRRLEDTAGIPTGIAPDIERQVAKRHRVSA